MKQTVVGPAFVLGDNIDTDQIFPGHYLALVDPQAIAEHCLAGIDPQIAGNFPPGEIIVAGRNFGCGSSREHAAIALQGMGAGAIIAESFARIFYRNAINLGLPLLVCPPLHGAIVAHETVQLDLLSGVVKTAEHTWQGEQLSGIAIDILQAGGIKPLMRQRLHQGVSG